jgi:phospholipid/cholesterol/gamma-HCH transport system substrate-binding protein
MGKTRLKVGLFVTISFFILAAAILWLAGSRFLQPVDTYHIVFKESVRGLLPGAAVEYQGVTVGKVETIRLTNEMPPRVDVTIALQPGTPVRQDTSALLVGSFVTGIRTIELEGGSATAPPMEQGGTIPIGGGEFEEFRDRAGDIAERLLSVLSRIEQDLLSEENRTAFATLLRNISAISETLRVSLEDVSTPETRASLRAMVDNLAQAAAGIKSATDAINNEGKTTLVQVRQTAAVTEKLAGEATQLAAHVDELTRHVNELVGENRQDFNSLLTNLADTSRHLKETAETLRTDPSELIWGRNLPEKEIPDK